MVKGSRTMVVGDLIKILQKILQEYPEDVSVSIDVGTKIYGMRVSHPISRVETAPEAQHGNLVVLLVSEGHSDKK